MSDDLARRAAAFHAGATPSSLVRRYRNDPEAWHLYVAWHQAHPDPAVVEPSKVAALIDDYRGER